MSFLQFIGYTAQQLPNLRSSGQIQTTIHEKLGYIYLSGQQILGAANDRLLPTVPLSY